MLTVESLLIQLDQINKAKYQKPDDVGRHLFDTLRPHIVTTFYLEPYTASLEEPELIEHSDPAYAKLTEWLYALPFPCMRIVRSLVGPYCEAQGWRQLDTDVIITNLVKDNGKTTWAWAVKDTVIHLDGTRKSNYAPNEAVHWHNQRTNNVPASFIDLMRLLGSRVHRYVERPVSRQIRRAEGFASSYREYIVIRRKDAAEHTGEILTLGQIIRRHPILHAVRGHIRKYRSGLITTVRPHTRGVGELFQVKDYITEEEHVRS